MLPPLLILAALSASPTEARGLDFYEARVRPALVEHCYSCHSARDKKLRGGLALDSRSAMLRGGDTGPAVVPGKPDASLLIKAVRHVGDLKMPLKGKVPDAVVADLVAWVELGAPAPEGKVALTGIDWTKARDFWSFRPVVRPAPPAVANLSWVRNPVDHFVLTRLEARKLSPVGQADPRSLLRRITFDLTGLPPTPEEVQAFLADSRPGAYERLVDRLLASPAHGERWGRHWLDVARYAEDQAHTFAVKPNTNAWRYRDWVLAALDSDMPYDQFVRLQIAADLLPDTQGEDRAALGFFGLGAQYYKNSDAARAAADELDDRVDTLARGFLGLTVSCARCHDHKYDPIPTLDYYSLAGIFQSSRLSDHFLAPPEQVVVAQKAQKRLDEADRAVKNCIRQEKSRMATRVADRLADYVVAAWKVRAGARASDLSRSQGLDGPTLDRMVRLLAGNSPRNLFTFEPLRKSPSGPSAEPTRQVLDLAGQLQARVLKLAGQDETAFKTEDRALAQAILGPRGVFPLPDERVIEGMNARQKAQFQTLRAELERAKRQQPAALPVAHGLADAAPVDMKVFVRGNPAQQGPTAPRRFLRVLAGEEAPRYTTGSGRTELAHAIASPANPLTARVIVNRLWMHHFGRGIVGTPSNFGALGEKPSHPELLDWLASELVEHRWSLKHLHRLIVTSATYRSSCDSHPANLLEDPDNHLFWRMNRRRLDVESWRDNLLAVAGQLDRTHGGPTLDLGSDSNLRRTVYGKISRHELNGLLRLFDFPDANITSEKRTETTVPQQQLFVLNSPFFVARAKGLASRAEAFSQSDPDRISWVYEQTFGRPPLPEELQLAATFLKGADATGEKGANQLTRWQRLAQALLASNEFLYVD